jgi:hypothetical protein
MKKALGIYSNPDRRWGGDGFPVQHSVGREDCDDDRGGQAYRRKTDRVSKRATLATPYRTVKAKSSR